MQQQQLLPTKTLAVLAALGAAHYATHYYHQSDARLAEQQANAEAEQELLDYVAHQVVERREKLALLVSGRTTTTDDITAPSVDDLQDLLEALADFAAILAVSPPQQHNWWDAEPNLVLGYEKLGRGIAAALNERMANARESDLAAVLNGPVQTLHDHFTATNTTALHPPPKPLQTRVNALFAKELALARSKVRERSTVQFLKAGAVLRRALPELPMIAISTVLSIYAGTLDSTRFYLRGEVLTRLLVVSTGGGGGGGARRNKAQLIYSLLGLEVLAILVNMAKERAQTIGKRRFIQNLKTDLFAALVSQDIAFFEREDMWEMRQLIGNSDSVCTSLLSAPTQHLESFARIASSLLLLFRQSPRLCTVLFCVALPGKQVITAWLEDLANQFEQRAALGGLAFQPSMVTEIWQTLVDARALKTMRSFAREPVEMRDFARAIRVKDARDERSAIAYQVLSPLRDALDKILDIFGVWYGGRLVHAAAMRAADLPAFVALSSLTFDQMRFLHAALSSFGQDVLLPIERMHDLLHSKPSIGIARKQEEEIPHFGLEFRDVHFAYPSKPNVEILRGVSFSVAPGERVGIMGESGCGKSTLFSLVERFYDPTAGQVLLGGRDLKEISPLYLRERIALVSQQSFMAKRTVKANLLYGRANASSPCTEEEMLEALELAQCAFFATDKARFPDGLLTDIGVNASKLSGGEVQRLSLARALLTVPAPQLLLLDEYTAALDETSQAKIVDAVQALWERRGITLLCIAHRLSNFKHVDRVIVLSKDGRVAEEGAPRDLLHRENGLFATFVKTSQVKFE